MTREERLNSRIIPVGSVLVTGAAGFIGSHVALRLLGEGVRVVGVDNFNPYYDVALKEARWGRLAGLPGFRGFRADLADADAVREVFAAGPFGAVLHFAAQTGVRYSLEDPSSYVQSNLVAFAHLLEACRHAHTPHLVFASSSSVYGLNTRAPSSVGDPVDHPVSLYGATKKANELMAHSYSHLFGLPVTGLRFFTVYGPWGRPDMAYFKFAEAIASGRPLSLYGAGELWRDFTYVDDVVEAVVRLAGRPAVPAKGWSGGQPAAATSSAPYRIYNVGNHQPVKITDFVATLERLIGRKAVVENLPMQPGDVVSTCADTTELRREVGFAPSTKLEDGLERFVAWLREWHALRGRSAKPG